MKFKDFEIRPVKSFDGCVDPRKYELVQWYKPDACYVVAWLIWNDNEKYWGIESVGLRLIEHWANGLNRFIIKWCEMAAVCMEDE